MVLTTLSSSLALASSIPVDIAKVRAQLNGVHDLRLTVDIHQRLAQQNG